MKKLRLGLDLGTNSVGYALVDENDNIIKKNHHAFWGVRMFEEASTAVDRRSARTNRRRLARRKFRVKIIRDLFAKEINAIDPTFFERLDDSFYYQEDKKNKNYYNLFTEGYTDKDFFNEYPTIFHLRKALMNEDKKFDIRMIYLAVVHIVKYRGNFLFNGDFNIENAQVVSDFIDDFNDTLINLNNEFEENYDEDSYDSDYFATLEYNEIDSFFDKLYEIMTSSLGKADKKRDLALLFNMPKKSLYNEFVIPLLAGSTINASNLSPVKDFGYEKCAISFDCEDITSIAQEASSNIKELSSIFAKLEELKSVFDFYFVAKILKDSNSLSDAMIKIYDEHKKDLARLKTFIHKYANDKYSLIFRKNGINNYAGYVGFNSVNSTTSRYMHVKREDFYKFLKKEIESIEEPSNLTQQEIDEFIDDKQYFIDKMDKDEFLLRQNSSQNGAFPKQLHFKELQKILWNQEKYYPFLKEVTDGYTTIEKIEKTFNYKIEYYVGPLNTKSEHSWVVRNSYEKIYPWNIDEIVNKDESAVNFIQRMQNKCTYLDNEYCMPKASIIFSEYNCLAYLNKITVNGQLLNKDIKEELFNELFLTKKQPTNKDICEYLKTNHGEALTSNRKELPDVNCNMSSYIQMSGIFGEEFVKENLDTIERIIQDITIFEDKRALESRLNKEYNLDAEQIKKLKGLTFKGYARISNKLLTGIEFVDDNTGEVCTVLDVMRSTNLNLQEVLYSENYKVMEAIDKENAKYKKDYTSGEYSLNDYIDENVAVSPAFKRSIIQAYTIILEIESIFKRPIDEYYVECTRTNKASKKKTKSRYEKIKELYKEAEKTCSDYELSRLSKELDDNQDKLKSDLIYLYFTQLGRCMYSLEPISLEDLITNNRTYDIDHIYPQSLIKDDSLSNRVLVIKAKNASKTDKFLFETNVQTKSAPLFYKKLLDVDLISREKYKRLTERQISPDKLDGFVNRQLVSTNQSVTGLIKVLKEYHNVDPQAIIYSKGENISDFRKEFDLVKSRTANNYHHAHDAYLNVVVGGIIDKYFKSKGVRFFKDYERIKTEHYTINPMKIFKGNSKNPDDNKIVKIGDEVIWNKNEDVQKINHNLYERFDITETTRTYSSNKLYKKETILPKGQGTVCIQTNTPRSQKKKYGAIDSPSYARYVIVECKTKKGMDVILEAIPKSAIPNNETIEDDINKYLEKIYVDKNDKPKYLNINVVNYNIKTNCIAKYENRKFMIASKTGDAYNLKNAIDRNFSKRAIIIIKKIDKFNALKKEDDLSTILDKLVISPARNSETNEVSLMKNELELLLQEILTMYTKEMYFYSSLSKIFDNIKDVKNYDFKTLFTLSSELLNVLKTNDRKLCNLSCIGLSKDFGTLKIGKNLNKGMKFLSESITGYYKKVIYEVK